MPRRVAVDDDWEEDPDDAWEPDEEDEWQPEPEDEDETTPCPHCQAPVYEGAEQCPACGMYLSEEDAPSSGKRWWIILGAVPGLLAVYLWIMR
ncbi:MAG TPA: zinc-ribbon domain-containing protein [Gemmataceae bacterium]|nr:zinc-ribbon domain-containing protein [Gemmataceae bacterium]